MFHFDLETDLKCDILLLQTAAIISAQLKLNRFLCHILVPNMDWEIFIFLYWSRQRDLGLITGDKTPLITRAVNKLSQSHSFSQFSV